MDRLFPIIMFFLTLTLVAILGHTYLWWRLIRSPAWGGNWQAVATGALICLALLVPVGLPIARMMPRPASTPLVALAYTWMGFAFLLIVAVLLVDALRWIGVGVSTLMAFFAKEDAAVDVGRRELIARGAAGTASLVALGTGVVALRGGLGEVDVKEVPVSLERLPRALSGYTIVQLTDIHIGPMIGKRFVEQVVDKTNREKPDAVVITGDLVDGSVEELAKHAEPLARLQARNGIYFVTGNHEYYSGAEPWIEHLEKLGIRVLRNERVELGDRGASFDLAGIDDEWAGRHIKGHGPDLQKALQGRDPERELVLLAHQPAAILKAAEAGVGLQLSGHTHGGQLFPFNLFVPLAQPYVSGLHRHGDGTQIYVSCGTGYWGPPMRLGAPAEVTKVVLT